MTKGQILLFSLFVGLTPLAVNVYLAVLPALANDLGLTVTESGYSLSVFFIGVALGQLVSGPLSDRLGRRPLILGGLLMLTVFSVIGASTHNYGVLIAARIGQALGACSVTVATRAAINDLLGPREAARMFSLLQTIASAAPILAPALGAFLVVAAGWRSVFVFLALFAALLGLAAYWRLPESIEKSGDGHEHPFSSYYAIVRNKQVRAHLLACIFSLATMFTFLGAMPSIIHSAFGDKPGIFGTVFALNASGLVIGSLLSRKLLQYMEPHQLLHRLVLYIGAVTAVLVLTGLVWPYAIIAFLVVQFLVSIGISMAQASGIALAMGGDRRRAGSIAALFGAGAFTVGALFSSIANALFDGSVSALAVIIAVCQVAMIVFLLTAENQRRRELAL